MSILKSTNSGGNTKLTIERLRSMGWAYPSIIESFHIDLDYSKLVRDEKHPNECLHIDRQTVGDPKKDYWFYAQFHKKTDKDCDVDWDVTIFPSNLIELSEVERYWDKARKQPTDPVEEFRGCKFSVITAIRKDKK